MTRVPNAMRDYYVAWTERILEDGRFRPAYYAHTHNAQQIYDDVERCSTGAGSKPSHRSGLPEAKISSAIGIRST